MTDIKIFSDGSCWNGQPKQPMGLGIATYINNEYSEEFSKGIKVDWEDDGFGTTSNIAEFHALLRALEIGLELKEKYPDAKFSFFADSDFVLKHANMKGYSQRADFVKYSKQAFDMIRKLKATATWISRKDNLKANEWSRVALDKKVYSKDRIY